MLVTPYHFLVFPYLNYCLEVWGGAQDRHIHVVGLIIYLSTNFSQNKIINTERVIFVQGCMYQNIFMIISILMCIFTITIPSGWSWIIHYQDDLLVFATRDNKPHVGLRWELGAVCLTNISEIIPEDPTGSTGFQIGLVYIVAQEGDLWSNASNKAFSTCRHFIIFRLNACSINMINQVNEMKWNESGFRPPLCTYRLNWARITIWGWWDDWDDTVLQTQDSKFEPWRSEAEHATSRSRRLPTILTFTREWGRNIFASFKPPRPWAEPRTLAWKAAVLTTTLGPPPWLFK